MLNNKICANCAKVAVCRNVDILYKFDESAKKQLGIDITIERCEHYEHNKNTD